MTGLPWGDDSNRGAFKDPKSWPGQGSMMATKPTRICPRCGATVISTRKDDHRKICAPLWMRVWWLFMRMSDRIYYGKAVDPDGDADC